MAQVEAGGSRSFVGAVLSFWLVAVSSACEPRVVVGTWTCPASDASTSTPVNVPWTTGFETGFCDYLRAAGWCYADVDASYRTVDVPTHSGRHAAAFSITTDPSKQGGQARCVAQGALPPAASYGGWFYLPSSVGDVYNWNLIHFQGSVPDGWHDLWDVSVGRATDGTLFLYVYDGLRSAVRMPSAPPAVPIGSWFHIEFRLARAKEATGEIALYQDGALLTQISGLVTDDSDLGQWYIGNLAEVLTPPDSTVYVDDVTVRP
jgi:hypothetical protein